VDGKAGRVGTGKEQDWLYKRLGFKLIIEKIINLERR